jgi:FtsX-like permease family
MTHLIRQFARRLRALVNRDTLNRDVDAEMRLHIELEASELAQVHALAPDEARRQAAIAFGGVDRFAEAHHDARGVRWLEEIGQDVGVVAMVVGRGMAYAIPGAIIGLLVSFVVRRRLEAVLFDVSGGDPMTLTVATGVFLVVALVASLLPARRAANVSPMEAIRES